MLRFIATFYLVSLAFGERSVIEINKLVDDAVSSKAQELKNLALPNRDLKFQIPFTSHVAGVRVKDGVVRGFENVRRTDESLVKINENKEREIIYFLGVRDVRLSAQAEFYWNNPIYNVHLKGRVDQLEVQVGLLNTTETLKVDHVRVTQFDGFTFEIDAPGFVVDTFVNTGLRASRFAYAPLVKSAIEERVRKVMEEEIREKRP